MLAHDFIDPVVPKAIPSGSTMREGNFDATNETIYQFGQMGDTGGPNGAGYGNQKYLHINAWATRNWIGYTHY